MTLDPPIPLRGWVVQVNKYMLIIYESACGTKWQISPQTMHF